MVFAPEILTVFISFLLSCGMWGLNSSHQAQLQVPLPVEPFYWPCILKYFKVTIDREVTTSKCFSMFRGHHCVITIVC